MSDEKEEYPPWKCSTCGADPKTEDPKPRGLTVCKNGHLFVYKEIGLYSGRRKHPLPMHTLRRLQTFAIRRMIKGMSDEKPEVYVCRFDGSNDDRKAGFVAFDAEGAAEEFVDYCFQHQQIETSKPYRVLVTSKDGVTTLWEVTMTPSLDVVVVSIP